jgi:V8-like Glu-specific endopeptidase
MSDVRLHGKQIEELTDAMLSVFIDETDLEKLTLFEMDVRLPEIVRSDNLETMTLKLIQWAEKKERLGDLLAGAMTQRPKSAALRRIALAISLVSEVPPTGKLESMVVPGAGFADGASWRSRMEQVEWTVCLLEIAGHDKVGTGFLVAPDIVMTNYHVAHNSRGQPLATARFDYRNDGSGKILPGDKTHAVNAVPLAESPAEDLDYALLEVPTRPGEEVVLDHPGVVRGTLRPAAHAFAMDEPLFVIQHPLRDPLKLGVGSVRKLALPKRVHYTANTQPGSSGSPCFTIQWEPVALHHQGDLGDGTNNGIPLAAVTADVRLKDPALAARLGW